MIRRKLSCAVIVGLAVSGLVASATPAHAAPVGNCGEAPAGGNLSISGGICVLEFETVGSYSWVVPEGADDLQGLIVGAASGTIWIAVDDPPHAVGGNGGSVVYTDLSATSPGTTLPVTVGEGSASTNGDTGATVSAGGASSIGATSAPGGAGISNAYVNGVECDLGGSVADRTYVERTAAGAGAGGSATASTTCALAPGPGVTPSIADVDSNGDAVLSLLATYPGTFGTGGTAILEGTLPNIDYGIGASTVWIAGDSPFTEAQLNDNDASGGDGLVVIMWTEPAGPDCDIELVDEPVGGELQDGAFELRSTATGEPEPTTQWQFQTSSGSSSPRDGNWQEIEHATEFSLTATEPGWYRAVFTSGECTVTSEAALVTPDGDTKDNNKLADTGGSDPAAHFFLAIALVLAGAAGLRLTRSMSRRTFE